MSREVARRYPAREAKRTISIYCEGRNTERIYFNALKQKLRAGYIEIVSDKNQGLSVQAMLKELKRRKKVGLISDEVYCVLDLDVYGDNHREIISQLESWRPSRVRVVPSRPCFEYWLLSHFVRTDAPFIGTPGGKTACDQLIDRLRAHVSDYDKSRSAVIRKFIEDDHLLRRGLENYAMCPQDPGNNPCTKVGTLVGYLLGLGDYT